jgi:ATP-dependent RNA helicase RhlE
MIDTNITGGEASSPSEINFSLGVLRGLKMEVPTPIQQQAIPAALSGQDIIGIAQTGTGKTLAFGIPIIQKLSKESGQALVMVPTRELALQVTESIRQIGQGLGFRLATLIGGEAIDRQLFMIRKKPHIIIATPGRLIDHLKRRTVKLSEIKILVLDEADMMLDLGFAPQIEEIMNQSPKEKQTMLFSATMPLSIAKLANSHLKLPIRIEVAPQGTTAEKVEQEIYIIRATERFMYLEKIIKEHTGSILVFVRTKHGVKKITEQLISLHHSATEIHSNLSLPRRSAALRDFKSGKVRMLIATDVAARGLDVNGIELVVNYNLPDASSDYVHRIGRTGRAGKVGKAISLATPDQLKDIRDIERLINKSIAIKEYAKLDRPVSRPFVKKYQAGGQTSKSYTPKKTFHSFGTSKPQGGGGGSKFGKKPYGKKPFSKKFSSSKPYHNSYHPKKMGGV